MSTEENSFKKKKKGRSFLQKAKKFGRQGQRGRGTEIEQDQYDYLVRVLERWKQEFECEEERTIFVENVMMEMEGKERQICGNQLGSRVIEMLLPSAEQSVLSQYSDCLSQDLRLVCLDPFMSHVLEKLLILQSFSSEPSQTGIVEASRDWVVRVSKFVTNNVEDFSQDSYASHLLRTCCECLVGQRLQEKTNQARTEGYESKNIWRFREDQPSVSLCDEVLETFSTRLSSLSTDTIMSELCVRVLTAFCQLTSTKHQQLSTSVIANLLTGVLSGGVETEDIISVRLAEIAVSHGQNDVELREKLYQQLLNGREEELACDGNGNFVIQRLLDHITDKEEFVKIGEKLAAITEDILSEGCTGVILSLVKTCVRLSSCQTVVMNKLVESLHCQDHSDSLAPCLLYMRTKERLGEETPSVHLHGSLMLQQLLVFSKPIKLVRSLLSLPASQLSSILSDPRGCHVTDSFMSSNTVGEKSRDGLVKALKGELAGLATSKHGSRTLDTLWRYASSKTKQSMVEELAYKVDHLNSNKFGKFLVKNWFITEYKRNKADWTRLVEQEGKIADSFKEIIGDEKVAVKRKLESSNEVQEVKKKKDVVDIVDNWLKPEVDNKEKKIKKKKAKVKSYLDDL